MQEWLKIMLVELSKKQIKIDNFLHKNKNLILEDTFKRRLIALFTEISEFVNEIRSFKYWSNKKESKKDVILEEYVDCIHFILSIGNTLKFDWDKYKINISFKDVNSLVLDSYVKLAFFSETNDKKDFEKFLNSFFSIIENKKFTKLDLFDAYLKKNTKNYNRQFNNY